MDSTLLLIGGGAFLLWFFGTRGAVVANLKFLENGMSFDVSNPLRIGVNLSVLVQNPTSGSVTLQSLAGYFAINNTQSGNVSYFVPTLIAANSQTQITLRLSINDLSLVKILMDYINGNSGSSIVVDIAATANVDNVPVPVNMSFSPL